MGLFDIFKKVEQATEDELRRASHKALHLAALAYSDAKKLVDNAEAEVQRCQQQLADAMSKAAKVADNAKQAAEAARVAAQAEAQRLVDETKSAIETAELHANHVITIHAAPVEPVAPVLDPAPVVSAVELNMKQELANATQVDTTSTNS